MDFGIITAAIGGTIAAFFGVKMLVKVGDNREDRRRSTMKLAGWARANGLPVLENLLENFTVGAKTELVGSIRQLVDIIRDEEQSKAVLDGFLKTQLAKKLSTDEGKKQILGLVEDLLGVTIDRESLVKTPVSIGQIEK